MKPVIRIYGIQITFSAPASFVLSIKSQNLAEHAAENYEQITEAPGLTGTNQSICESDILERLPKALQMWNTALMFPTCSNCLQESHSALCIT